MLELRFLGACDVQTGRPSATQDTITQPRRLALLLYLAIAEPGGLHARDRLIALLWPDADEASARHSLRNALHALRRALGDEALVTSGDAFVGLAPAVNCDVRELRAHLAAGRIEEALALWHGELVPGFHVSGAPEFERWLEGQRRSLLEAVRAAAWGRARQLEGRGEEEIEAVRRAVRLDPLDEPGTRHLMRLLVAAGDRAGAVRACEELAAHLAHEIGAEPSPETRALADAARAGAAPGTAAEGPVANAVEASRRPAAEQAAAPSEPGPIVAGAPRRRRRVPGLLLAGGMALLALAGASRLRRPAPAPAPDAAAAERAVLRLPARYRADTSAYASYLRGLALRFRYRFMASRDTFAALVDREPLYVPGLCGLAHALLYTGLNGLTDPAETWPKVDVLARRALALDSSAASAWLARASLEMFARQDLARADEMITRAAAIDSTDPDAAGLRSVWFRFHGRMDSAVAYATRAHRLEPVSGHFARLLARQLFYARRFDEARRAYERYLQDEPGFTRLYPDMAELYRAMGRPRDAVDALRRARLAAGDTAGAALLAPAASDAEAWRLIAADARRTIARLDASARAGRYVNASDYARAWAAQGDTAETLRWLGVMLETHESYLHHVRVDPAFDFLRGDPRYVAWEARTGLPALPPHLASR